MTRIKICGITNKEDARAAIDYGADALGFIFVPQTPRYVGSAIEVETLLTGLPPFVARVGVCLQPAQIPISVIDQLTTVQFYSDDWHSDWTSRKDLVQAVRVRDMESLDEIARTLESGKRRLAGLHLDAYHKDKLGGSGETFDWEVAIEAKRRFSLPLILAGGLTPENIEEAIAAVRPFAVDVSSGVEAEPGRKDHGKLKAFLQAVRRADSSLQRT